MKSSKNIKVYGTLVNHTLDSTLADETHNDALMNAYQLFDGRFGDSPLPNNFQDVINKRITDITFDGGTTTIENRDEVTENHYTLVVNGDTNLNGDVHITEDLHVDGDTYLGDTHIDGDLYVTGDISGISLGDLENVNKNADSASAGTFLKYNGTEWLPVSIALSDVFGNIGNAFEGAILKYKSGAWTFDTNELNKLADVDISNIQEGSILKWDASANKWKMGSDASGDALPQGLPGYVLKYINGEWQAAEDLVGATLMSELNDVDITGLAVGKILKWNGTNWYVADDNSGSSSVGATALSQLSDVNIPNPENGAKLVYDSATGKWIASSGASTTGMVLDDLANVTENGKIDSSLLAYDATGQQWKPVSFDSTSNMVYHQYQVTFTKKVSKVFSDGCNTHKNTVQTSNYSYPGANTVYVYSTNAPFNVPNGETISSIVPGSTFTSVGWNVTTFRDNLTLRQIPNMDNAEIVINGTTKYNWFVMTDEYGIKSSDIQSAASTTSNTSRYTNSTWNPLLSNGAIRNYTRSSNDQYIVSVEAHDWDRGMFATGIKIDVTTVPSIADATNATPSSVYMQPNGVLLTYAYDEDGSSDSSYYNLLTTNYVKLEGRIDSNYNYLRTATSVSKQEYVLHTFVNGTETPITIPANSIMFNFVASNTLLYPDTFTATVITYSVEQTQNNILGFSLNKGELLTSVATSETGGSVNITNRSLYAKIPLTQQQAINVINPIGVFTPAQSNNTSKPIRVGGSVAYDSQNSLWYLTYSLSEYGAGYVITDYSGSYNTIEELQQMYPTIKYMYMSYNL